MTLGRLITLVALGALIFFAGFSTYLRLPKLMQFELTSFFERPFAPNFDVTPKQMTVVHQEEWINEFKRRDYNLHCYAAVYPEDRVSKDDDYVCWAVVKSAYDNIPAKMVTFWFRKGEMQHLKIDFPDTSYTQLQDFLGRHFKGVKRLDEMPGFSFDTDIYGSSLMVWPTRYGIVATNASPTKDRPLSLLWSSNESYGRLALSRLEELLRKANPAFKLPSTTKLAPVAPRSAPSEKLNVPSHQNAVPSGDLSQCLDLSSNEEITKCVNGK